MACEDGARFLLPLGDCAMLPIVHSTAEELAQYLWHRITTVSFVVCGGGGIGRMSDCLKFSHTHTHTHTHLATHRDKTTKHPSTHPHKHTHKTPNRASASTGCSPAGSTRCRSSSPRPPSRRAPTRAASWLGRSRCVEGAVGRCCGRGVCVSRSAFVLLGHLGDWSLVLSVVDARFVVPERRVWWMVISIIVAMVTDQPSHHHRNGQKQSWRTWLPLKPHRPSPASARRRTSEPNDEEEGGGLI
jgi:hypothetical protein